MYFLIDAGTKDNIVPKYTLIMDLDSVPTFYFSLTNFITFELKTDIELLILINHPTELSEGHFRL